MALKSLRDIVKRVLDYKADVTAGRNPNTVTAAQIGAYTKEQADAAISPTVQAGDWPLSAFGDMGFSLPNISSRYEGATTFALPVVYQMEQDGSRNFLRSGCDGQIYGVYLCKMQVNILRRLTGYNPMATPWRPAYLDADDNLVSVCRGISGQVVVQAKSAAGVLSIRISTHNGTLDPAMHTSAISCPIPPLFDVHRTLFILEGTTVWALSPTTNNTVAMDIRRSENGGPWNIGAPLTGTDVCGVERTDVLLWLAQAYTGTETTGYMLNNPDVALQSIMQGGRQYTDAIYLGAGRYRLHIYHEVFLQTATAAQTRELVLREVDVDFTANTYALTAASQGQLTSSVTGGVPTILGSAKIPINVFGLVTWANRTYAQSRCMTSGEVMITTYYPGYGYCNPQYSPNLTYDQWLNPRTRPVGHAQGLVFDPSYATLVGNSLKAPRPTPDNNLVITSYYNNANVNVRLVAPAYLSPIDYTHPDGGAAKWAVDDGRTAINQNMVTQYYAIYINRAGVVRYIQTLAEDRLTANDSLDELCNPIGNNYSTSAAVISSITNYVAALAASKGWTLGGTKVVLMRTEGIPRMANRILVCGSMYGTPNNTYAYMGLFDPVWDGDVLTGLAATPTVEYIRQSGSNATNYSMARYGQSSGSISIGEMDDCTFIGGQYPWLVNFAGASGYPTVVVTLTGTDAAPVMNPVTGYLGSVNATGSTIELFPGIGAARRNMTLDNLYAQTVMTYNVFGFKNSDIIGMKTQQVMVVASQSVYGSWNLYISEDIQAVIMGVPANIPRRTFDLRTIKADPTNTTFYLYAYLDQGVCAYTVLTAPNYSRYYVLAAIVRTDASRIVSVEVRKTFAIAGIQISTTGEPNSIPGKTVAG